MTEFSSVKVAPEEMKSLRHYITELCPKCRQQRMYPDGSKFRCENCGAEDFFPEGDSVEI